MIDREAKMKALPKLKRKISSFLTKEDGKISKEALIKTGVLLTAAAIANLKSAESYCPVYGGRHADHCNELSLNYADGTSTGQHSNSTHNSY